MADDVSDCDGFSMLTKSYKRAPTIENYVALRRNNPLERIEVAVSGGIEWLFASKAALERFDISAGAVAGALDAGPESISELRLRLLELMIARKREVNAGRTHVVSCNLAIGDELINFLINLMLDALDWNDVLHIPRDLIVLVRY